MLALYLNSNDRVDWIIVSGDSGFCISSVQLEWSSCVFDSFQAVTAARVSPHSRSLENKFIKVKNNFCEWKIREKLTYNPSEVWALMSVV